MDEDRIALVLARISELSSKTTNCIAAAGRTDRRTEPGKHSFHEADVEVEADDSEEATDCLLAIREALQKLELQVSSLQVLQQQQLYEREEALSGIFYSQEELMQKLKEYKGENLDVIQEAIAFVGETVEEHNDLLLPPYPTRTSSFLLPPNKTHASHFQTLNNQRNLVAKGGNGSKTKKSLFEMTKSFIGGVVKTALPVLGVISVLTLAGFEPSLKKRNAHFQLMNLSMPSGVEEKERKMECPPGKVQVVENGEVRCVVRERVEVPFEAAVSTPDVSYGCG